MFVRWVEPCMIDTVKTCLRTADNKGLVYTGTLAGCFYKKDGGGGRTMLLVAMSDGTFYEVPASKCHHMPS